jgi:hypothetical protein
MKRERYHERLSIRVSRPLWEQIAHAAAVSGKTPSEIIRCWLEAGAMASQWLSIG